MNDKDCRDFLCKEEIHSSKDWKVKALATKNKLRNAGVADFENHPEYRKITDCKPDDDNYPSKSDCNSSPRQSAPSRPVNTGKRGRCPKGTTFNKRTQDCEPKNRRSSPVRPASPRRQASPVRPTSSKKRCQKGTRRNKRTGNCEPKNRQSFSGRAASPSRPTSAKKRCPNGTRRNKKTGNCQAK
jgi:hypothetical protein